MKTAKQIASGIIPACIWRKARQCRIARIHKRAAACCESLIAGFTDADRVNIAARRPELIGEKVIWQYWAQGFDNVPDKVRKCLDSVERYAGEYRIIRLSDGDLADYLDLPGYVMGKRSCYSVAFFSDLLRVLLLSTYGGIWLDATVMLTGPIPEEYLTCDYFLFQRDPDEKDKEYWQDTYAYYFGWYKGFRVNMLSSIMIVKRDSAVVRRLAELMLKWWRENDAIPDYFFLQILYDVLVTGPMKEYRCPVVSDCRPHYLQQSINDPRFYLMGREEIMATIPIHKLTYK